MSLGLKIRWYGAWTLLIGSLIGWPMTHILMIVTHPPDASSWVFHVLLAISWLAIILTALDILNTVVVQRTQEEEDG